MNLKTFTNDSPSFSSPDDGFQKYQRGVSTSIPFALLDDTLRIEPTALNGIVKEGNCFEFFGIADTVNDDNTGVVKATWVFDISKGGPVPPELCIDMAAMGDFETSNDFFSWSYQIDGGSAVVAFQSTVDESGSYTYTFDSGAMKTENDPMYVNGSILTNVFNTFCVDLSGTGSELSLTLEASMDGGSEGVAFQNIMILRQC